MIKFNYLLPLLLLFCTVSAIGGRKKVMVLHSYHMGLEWTDNVTKGIKKAIDIDKENVEVFYEFLDTKRNLSKDYDKHLEHIYNIKLKGILIDVIICCDNYSLNFALKKRDVFFRNIPIVFCGINNFTDDMLQNQTNVTGVVESPDLKATIQLITELHSNVNNLCIINDNKTTTAIENKKILKHIESKFADKLTFDYWENYTTEEITQKLNRLSFNDAVLLLTFNKDSEGNFLSYGLLHKLVPKDIKQPVYAPWQFFMKPPVIGGKVIYGEDQGYRAGKKAIRILKGELADDIPINMNSLSKFVFLECMLNRFNIKKSQLPKGSIVINEPVSFWKANKKVIIWTLIILIISAIIIGLLLYNITKRKKTQLELIEKQNVLKKRWKFQRMNADIVALLNSTNDFTLVIDDILQMILEHYNFCKVTIFCVNEEGLIDKIIGSKAVRSEVDFVHFHRDAIPRLQRILGTLEKNDYFVSNDLSNTSKEEYDLLKEYQIDSFSIFPIRMSNNMLGVAGFGYCHAHNWKGTQIQELLTIVGMIANAWERNIQMNKHLWAEKKNLKANLLLEKSSRLASIGVIASGITHEINQPLNALRVTVDSLRFWERKNEGNVPEIVSNKLDVLSKGVSRIDNIISHMRKFWILESELEAATEVNLSTSISNAYSLIQWQIQESFITGKLVLPRQEIIVKANSVQIEQIIINFVVNSIQAFKNVTNPAKVIKLEVIDSDSDAIIVVSDNATGIAPEIGDKIYDPFYTSKTDESGKGLGLAIVKTIVDKINGKIKYENNTEGGVSFYISISKSKNTTLR